MKKLIFNLLEGVKQSEKGGNIGSEDAGKKQIDVGPKTGMVGDVSVEVRDGKGIGGQDNGNGKMVREGGRTGVDWECVLHKKQPVATKLTRMYRSNSDDLQWARKGVLANVVNGEAITVVQNRVEDAGFADLDVFPLGADRVFLRSKSDKDIMSMLG